MIFLSTINLFLIEVNNNMMDKQNLTN